MKYIVFVESSSVDLEKMVCKYLKMGWELQGGISMTYTPDCFGTKYYAQAMVKK